VLVADDNPVVRLSLRGLLRSCGCEVDDAANGRQVLDRVRRRSYDVILIDLQMPVMDGLETARRLAADLPAAHRPRLIMITADLDPETLATAEASGVSEVLLKPVRFAELSGLLGTTRAADPLPAGRVRVGSGGEAARL
jgi:CheY-like chemotaxis protein